SWRSTTPSCWPSRAGWCSTRPTCCRRASTIRSCRASSTNWAGRTAGSWSRRSVAKAPGRSCWRSWRSLTARRRMRWKRRARLRPKPRQLHVAMPKAEPGSMGVRGMGEPRMNLARTKKPGMSRVFPVAVTAAAAAGVNRRAASGSGSLQRLDAGVQAGLVTGCLVLVDQATRAETIEDRLGDLEGGFSAGGVVLAECLQHLLDGGAQHRALARVAGIAHDGLLGALLGGLDVSHGVFLEIVGAGRRKYGTA